jgi:hypothetical protein
VSATFVPWLITPPASEEPAENTAGKALRARQFRDALAMEKGDRHLQDEERLGDSPEQSF